MIHGSRYDYSKVEDDAVDEEVRELLVKLYSTDTIIIVSWREDSCRGETESWLYNNKIPFSALYMRWALDNRNDAIVKKEIAETYILPMYNVRGVFDDRNRVVATWREMGLTCFQVAYGDF